MQESKEAGPHITTREELDALYKNNKELLKQNERPDQDKIELFLKVYDTMKEQKKTRINYRDFAYSVSLHEINGNKSLQIDDVGVNYTYVYTLTPNGNFQIRASGAGIKDNGWVYDNKKKTETDEYAITNYVGEETIQKYRTVLDTVYNFLIPQTPNPTPQDSIPSEMPSELVPPK